MVVHQQEIADRITVLSKVPFFADLTQDDLAGMADWFREDAFEADDTIFFEGDEALRFWVVKDGQVKIIKYGKEGREIVIEVIPSGEIFGGATMLMTHNPATAQALTDCVTLSLSVDQYRDALTQHPVVGVRVIEALGERMLSVVRMRVLANRRVERRLAHILLKMADKCGVAHEDGTMLSISMTRQDLAEFADTTLETAIRTMSAFRKNGLVKTLRGGYILLRDIDALRELAGGDQSP